MLSLIFFIWSRKTPLYVIITPARVQGGASESVSVTLVFEDGVKN